METIDSALVMRCSTVSQVKTQNQFGLGERAEEQGWSIGDGNGDIAHCFSGR